MVGDWFDPLDPRPPYRQLAAIIRGQVDAGEFGPGDMIPSEKTLEQTYGVARDTARKVAAVLRDEGVAVTIPRPRNVRPARLPAEARRRARAGVARATPGVT